MTYYNIQTSILVTVEDGKIVSVQRKPVFKFDVKMEMNSEDRMFYGRIGTAYHSGKQASQISEYMGGKSLVHYPSPVKTATPRNYSVCDKVLDIGKFRDLNMNPFFTDDVDIMPALGYVVVNAKIRYPSGSLFETPCNIEGEIVIPVIENLEGDNIGQMAQLVAGGKQVYNSVYDTAFKNPFYGCTLSLLPLKNQDTHTVVMRWETFCSYFKGLGTIVPELTKSFPVELDCDKEVFGFDKVRIYTGSQPYLLSGFHGFLKYFTKGEIDFFYSYQGKHTDIVCGYNKTAIEKTEGFNQSVS